MLIRLTELTDRDEAVETLVNPDHIRRVTAVPVRDRYHLRIWLNDEPHPRDFAAVDFQGRNTVKEEDADIVLDMFRMFLRT